MRAMLVAGIVLLCAGACGPADSAGSGEAGVATASPGPQVVHFTARDYEFQGPDTVAAGMTTLVLHNEGPNWHHLQLFRLEDGMTVADFEAGMAGMKPGDPPLGWMHDAGGVNPPEPGSQATATLMLEPGDYAVVCVVDTPDHVPHIMRGMARALTVVPSDAAPVPAPAADLTLTLVDYTFSFSAPPTAGSRTIRVVNGGPQPHEVAIFRLKPGKTMDDFVRWGGTYQGEVPVEILGGAAAMAVGQEETVRVDLTPGDYVAACFVLDAKDGMPHIVHGMALPFSVS